MNGQKPPAYHLDELYRQVKPRARKYNKPIEMRDILRGKDLTIAADACPEFKSFLNTLLALNGLAALRRLRELSYPFFTYLSKNATDRCSAVLSDCERLWSSPR